MLYPPFFLRPRYTDTCRKEKEKAKERERERGGGGPLAFAMWDLQSSQSYDGCICALLRMMFLGTDHIQVYIPTFRYV